MELVKSNFDTEDIIQAILKCHELYNGDTVGIASKLKGNSFLSACRNIHDYVYRTIKYKLDKSGIQFAKRPNRTLTEKEGDCKSMSLLSASLLYNLGIPFSFRFASYDGREYTHVYVVAHGQNSDVIIDPVWTGTGGSFNTEKKLIGQPKDYRMKAGLYIGSTKAVGEITDKELFAKYYPPVTDMLVRLNRNVQRCVQPNLKSNALAFLQAVADEAQTNQAKLLIFNGYANKFLSGKTDWTTTFKALAVVISWKAPLGVGNIFSDAWESTKDFVTNVGDSVGDKFHQFTDWAGNVVSDAGQAAASAAARVANKAKAGMVQFASWSSTGIKDFVSDPKKFLTTEIESAKENAQKAWEYTKQFTLAPVRVAFMVVMTMNMFGLADKVAKGGDSINDVWKNWGGEGDLVEKAKLAVIVSNNSDVRKVSGIGNPAAAVAAPGIGAPLITAITSALGAVATAVKIGLDAKQLAQNTKSDIDKITSDFKDLIGDKATADAKEKAAELEKQIEDLQDLGGNPNQASFPWMGVGISLLALAGMVVYGGKMRKAY